jgi:hypothetical protein
MLHPHYARAPARGPLAAAVSNNKKPLPFDGQGELAKLPSDADAGLFLGECTPKIGDKC